MIGLIFLLATLWIISGWLLAGFGFGPFYNYQLASYIKKARVMLFWAGAAFGPFIAFPIIGFYHEFWGTAGVEKIQWKFLFSK